MKNSKRFFSAVLALICVLSVFTAIPVTADAAYSCTQVSGNSSKSRTFYINTGDRFLFADKLTLTQTQGTMDFTGWNGFGSKTVKGYEGYVISVVKTSGGTWRSDKRTLVWRYSKSYTISLQKNALYIITVMPINEGDLTLHYMRYGTFMTWVKPSVWKVSSTKGVISCNDPK